MTKNDSPKVVQKVVKKWSKKWLKNDTQKWHPKV